ncbi:VanZ family protein [Acidobacteria bacterium AH-259-D05]|nr:VanZ family protein [Acidobacteria bacterium AH-259-D05]
MINNIYYWGPAFGYATLIFFLSHQSNPPGANWPSAFDIVAHFFEYALFALTLAWGMTVGLRQPLSVKGVAFACAVAVLYALSDEWHQSFVPNREASLQDVAADVLGSVLCLVAVFFTKRGRWR